MRTSNKLKIVQIIILIYISILLSVQAVRAQGGPPFGGGPGQGGPPPPPDNYCQQFPDDPACRVAVPIGDWKWQLGAAFLAGLFATYKLNGNSFKFKKS